MITLGILITQGIINYFMPPRQDSYCNLLPLSRKSAVFNKFFADYLAIVYHIKLYAIEFVEFHIILYYTIR